jgi:hypothetical protein
MDPSYYASPGPLTESGGRFADLPEAVVDLCAIVQGLLLHPAEARHYGVHLGRARWRELALDSVGAKLARLGELDAAPLGVARPPWSRLVGNCRDFALMLCAMLRAHSVPARVRYGFATYFARDFYTDHAICEYWERSARRWMRADALLDAVLAQVYAFAGDPLDLTGSQFVVAGRAWQLWRAGALSPAHTGLAPAGPGGVAFIRTGMLRDLAALQKVEPRCQERWDLRRDTQPKAQVALLDDLAVWLCEPDRHRQALRAAFERESLLNVPVWLRAAAHCAG